MSCTHGETRQYWYEGEDDWTGEPFGEWRTEEICFQEDIDLHRFKCTRCGEVGYYSGAARQYYESGVKSPGITGLE